MERNPQACAGVANRIVAQFSLSMSVATVGNVTAAVSAVRLHDADKLV